MPITMHEPMMFLTRIMFSGALQCIVRIPYRLKHIANQPFPISHTPSTSCYRFLWNQLLGAHLTSTQIKQLQLSAFLGDFCHACISYPGRWMDKCLVLGRKNRRFRANKMKQILVSSIGTCVCPKKIPCQQSATYDEKRKFTTPYDS